MSTLEKLKKALRIYIVPMSASRAHDWMESHGLLRPSEWRDPRVTVVLLKDQLMDLSPVEGAGVEWVFLPDWKKGRSPDFIQMLWHRVPHIMNACRVS